MALGHHPMQPAGVDELLEEDLEGLVVQQRLVEQVEQPNVEAEVDAAHDAELGDLVQETLKGRIQVADLAGDRHDAHAIEDT